MQPQWKALSRVAQRADAQASQWVGWLADRQIPRLLRKPFYRAFAWLVGANLSECLQPLETHPSLSAFFVRRLARDARPLASDPQALVSPCDGRLQELGHVRQGELLQAKGQAYTLEELSAGLASGASWEGALAWSIYLSPKDYHRVHAPCAAQLVELRWVDGTHRSVAPAVVARKRVFAVNERCVLLLDTTTGPCLLVMVGARNVSRIRVVGAEPGQNGRLSVPRQLARGEELARFELGSTVVLITPPGRLRSSPTMVPGRVLRLGEAMGHWIERAP